MKISAWLGREFVALSSEGTESLAPREEAQEIFHRLDDELKIWGLSLEETVRTRLWARDRESRDAASNERFKILSGRSRSASSSYIAPGYFESGARIAVDLVAMRPPRPGLKKSLKECEPPIVPLRYLIYDSVVFLSGVTAVLPTLADQVADILTHISGSLADAGSSWDKVASVSCFLHRSQQLEALKELFQKTVRAQAPQMEYAFVDGYSGEGKLVEIEVTATA
jgi:enamine deaminase RidA (YjgF/YER057c/UK114 family)